MRPAGFLVLLIFCFCQAKRDISDNSGAMETEQDPMKFVKGLASKFGRELGMPWTQSDSVSLEENDPPKTHNSNNQTNSSFVQEVEGLEKVGRGTSLVDTPGVWQRLRIQPVSPLPVVDVKKGLWQDQMKYHVSNAVQAKQDDFQKNPAKMFSPSNWQLQFADQKNQRPWQRVQKEQEPNQWMIRSDEAAVKRANSRNDREFDRPGTLTDPNSAVYHPKRQADGAWRNGARKTKNPDRNGPNRQKDPNRQKGYDPRYPAFNYQNPERFFRGGKGKRGRGRGWGKRGRGKGKPCGPRRQKWRNHRRGPYEDDALPPHEDRSHHGHGRQQHPHNVWHSRNDDGAENHFLLAARVKRGVETPLEDIKD